MHGPVAALDDFRHAVVPADLLNDLSAVAVRLGEEDVAGAAQGGGRLAQGAARQHVAGAEGRGFVHQHDVVPVLELEVLQAVVEQQHIRAEFADGVGAGLHAVAVHHHGHAFAVLRQHVGLVTGHIGVEQNAFAIRDDARQRLARFAGESQLRGDAPAERDFALAFAFVAPAQDGDPPPALVQRLGEELHHRCLPRAADGDVADADHRHAQMVVVDVALTVEEKPQPHRAGVNAGKQPESRAQQRRPDATLVVDDHLNEVLFEVFKGVFHPAGRRATPYSLRAGSSTAGCAPSPARPPGP